MGELDGKVAVVTGSTRGIGRGIATRFAAEGAQVVVTGTTTEACESVAAEIGAHPCPADLGDPDAAAALVTDTIERFGHVDVLVNNAAVALDNFVTGATNERWQTTLDVNLTAAFVTMREAVRSMKERGGGSIVHITSWAGTNGNVGQVAYSASKAGMVGMTKAAAKELAPFGIRVNALAPQTPTDLTAGAPEEMVEQARLRIPMQRFGEMDEVAEGVLWLASDRSSFTTGQVLNVDGGLHLV